MPDPFPTLELPDGRVRIEQMTLEHAPALFAAIDDPECWAFTAFPRPRDVAGMLRYIEAALEAQAAGTDIALVKIDTATGRVAGTTRYCDIQPRHRHVEIGWTMIGPAWRRTGFNTQCKYLLLKHAFESMEFGSGAPGGSAATTGSPGGCVRVTLKCDARNLPSQRAIERIGAMHEGRLRRHRILPDGYVRDTMYYSVIAEEWPAVKLLLEGLIAAGR